MAKLNFEFRKRLDAIIDGDHHNYCYQCGACVADCPAARYSPDFNPRQIMLLALLGQEEALIGENSPIWLCTNCYTCYERCPQDVRPIEVIIALKNIASGGKRAPGILEQIQKSVNEQGRTVAWSPLVDRRRKELGLEPVKPVPVEEIQKLLEE
ncbi:MAG: 4Fe-4S dicluster domain-containing protein [Candidatus Eisenbacteria sp.]|nr:4Fe-4S dicluster domain-containing protein [Candidatus Eisenbacteria bacterium]